MQQTARFRVYVQEQKQKNERETTEHWQRERSKKNTRIHQMGRTSEWINSKRAANTGEEMQVFSLLLIVYIVNNVVCALNYVLVVMKCIETDYRFGSELSIVKLNANVSAECASHTLHQHGFMHFHRKSIQIFSSDCDSN